MIFLVGPHGSGKTELGKRVSENGFHYLDLGPIVRNYYAKSTEFSNIGEWVDAGEKVLGINFADYLLANEVLQYVYKNNVDLEKLVISGNRQLIGIMFLVNFFSEFKGKKVDYSITYIDAPVETLLERYNKRDGKNLTMEEFKAKFAKEDETLNEIRWVVNNVINNTGTVDEMYDTFVSGLEKVDREIGSHLKVLN